MSGTVVELNGEQVEALEEKLDSYDSAYIGFRREGSVSIGIEEDGRIVAGLDGCMTAFRILYVFTVFVEEAYRRKGYGRRLMEEMERRAKSLGANTIRLDTFSWQGREFYEALGYQAVGHYANAEDGYEEFFFLKRI